MATRRRPAAASRFVVAGLSCSATILLADGMTEPATVPESPPEVVVTVTVTGTAPAVPAPKTTVRRAPVTRSNGS